MRGLPNRQTAAYQDSLQSQLREFIRLRLLPDSALYPCFLIRLITNGLFVSAFNRKQAQTLLGTENSPPMLVHTVGGLFPLLPFCPFFGPLLAHQMVIISTTYLKQLMLLIAWYKWLRTAIITSIFYRDP